MTNAQIIYNEALNAEMYTEEQLKEYLEKGMLPLNTFQGWKELGYVVKKGQKAKIKCKLWKYSNYKMRPATEKEKENMGIFGIAIDEVPEKPNHYYMTNAALFDISQVEKIA